MGLAGRHNELRLRADGICPFKPLAKMSPGTSLKVDASIRGLIASLVGSDKHFVWTQRIQQAAEGRIEQRQAHPLEYPRQRTVIWNGLEFQHVKYLIGSGKPFFKIAITAIAIEQQQDVRG